MSALAADNDLFFVLLALQNGLIDREQLVAAYESWTLDKTRSLAEHLVALGHLDAARRGAVEAIASIHLGANGGEVERSLAAICSGSSVCASFAAVGDPRITETLVRYGAASPSEADRGVGDTKAAPPPESQRYRVLRPHDRGGLGAIFVAHDQELHREVALKQIHEEHADDPSSRTRFLLEAEITGRLEHPGIVPVYGLGSDVHGRPYYAMRLVKGDSFKEVADRFHTDESLRRDVGRRSLELRKLLRRFLDVCNAIEYAHSRGVLHRDIKPGNIIIGKYGETLVVDWGLAKVVRQADRGGDVSDETLMPSLTGGSAGTLPGGALGTPAYMSPEQAAGDLAHVGIRSDVYGLGATLYYLLTGRAPVSGSTAEMLAAVKRGEIGLPRHVDPAIDPALEAVCLKAMALRPENRYASSKELSEDIDRWLADEPVTAWREPPSWHARRWTRRNRLSVVAALVALCAGVVGLSAVLVVQARDNRELARSQAAVQARYELAVNAVKTFHTGVSQDFLLSQEQFKELRDRLLKSAAEFYTKLGSFLGRETDLASRRALADSNSELAVLTGEVGRVEEALMAHRRSESILQGLAESDASARQALAACRTKIGWLLYRTGRTAEAMEAYRQAQGELEPLTAAPAATYAARLDLADTFDDIGILLTETGKLQEAEAAYRRALEIQVGLARDHPAKPEVRNGLAHSHSRLGRLLTLMVGRTADAEAEYRAAVTIQSKLVEDYPAAEYRNRLVQSHHDIGNLLYQTGRLKEGEAEYRKSLELLNKLAEDYSAVTELRSRLAVYHLNLGLVMSNTMRADAAQVEFRKAVAVLEKLVEEHPGVADYRKNLATGRSLRANVLSNMGRFREAEAEHRSALTIQRKLTEEHPDFVEYHMRLIHIYQRYGDMLLWAGRAAEAEAAARQTVTILRKVVEDHPENSDFPEQLAGSHNKLGILLMDTGRPEAAEPEFAEASRLCRGLQNRGVDRPGLREVLDVTHLRMGMLRERTEDWNKAIEHDREAARNEADPLGPGVWALARVLGSAGFHDEAIGLYRRLGSAHPNDPRGPCGLGYALLFAGRRDEALRAFRDAVRLAERAVAADPVKYHQSLLMALNGLGRMYQQMGKISEAEAEFCMAYASLKQGYFPKTPSEPDAQAVTLHNLSMLLRRAGGVSEAKAAVERDLANLEKIVQSAPVVHVYRGWLAWAYLHRGLVRRATGNLSGAAADARRAVELFEPLPSRSAQLYFLAACAHATLAGLPRGGRPDTSPTEADTAMVMLREAVAMGYRDSDGFRFEDALDSLRGRLDFRLLLMDLSFPARPFARVPCVATSPVLLLDGGRSRSGS